MRKKDSDARQQLEALRNQRKIDRIEARLEERLLTRREPTDIAASFAELDRTIREAGGIGPTAPPPVAPGPLEAAVKSDGLNGYFIGDPTKEVGD
jgi:hypothetical protein